MHWSMILSQWYIVHGMSHQDKWDKDKSNISLSYGIVTNMLKLKLFSFCITETECDRAVLELVVRKVLENIMMQVFPILLNTHQNTSDHSASV